MNSLPKEIRDVLEPFHTREDFMKLTPTACTTEMNRLICAMSHTHFHGRYSGESSDKRKKRNDDDAVNAADDVSVNTGPWKKIHGSNFNSSRLSQEQRQARYKAGICFNCGSKQHLHVNCPHDDAGKSKPGSHGTGKSKAKAKGKGKWQGGRGGDQANTIEPATKKNKKAKAAEVEQLAIVLEKRMKKSLTKAVVENINKMEADVTETVSGNGQGAAVSRDATPSTTGNTRRTGVRFRLPSNE